MAFTMTPEMPRKKRMKSDFGERLIELRKARGLTQYDLADLIGTTQRTISYYENEGGHPQAPMMAHLARALNISTDELLGVKKGVRTSQAKKAAANHEDPEIRRVWKKFQQLLTLLKRTSVPSSAWSTPSSPHASTATLNLPEN